MGSVRGGPELVVLVDEHDNEEGTMEKLAAHLDGGRLHRAVSVFIVDASGRVMLQKRAIGKYHFGGLWTNTCCTHPRPGEPPASAGRRRLCEEMGIDAEVEPVGRFIYRSSDPSTGLTEHELDHVVVGRYEGEPRPDPAEAEGWRWASVGEVEAWLRARGGEFTPWFAPAWKVFLARGGSGGGGFS